MSGKEHWPLAPYIDTDHFSEYNDLDGSYFENRVFPTVARPFALQVNELNPPNRFLSHWHTTIEILLIHEGILQIMRDGQTVLAEPGNIAIIHSDALHAYAPGNGHCCYHCLFIEPKGFTDLGVDLEHYRFPLLLTDRSLTERFRDLLRCHNSNSSFHRLREQGIFLSLLSDLMERFAEPVVLQQDHSTEQITLVKQITKHLRAHLSEPISIDEISSEVNFSKSYVCRTFRRYTGKTIVEMINEMRCTQAAQLLESRQYAVSEVARMCGFSNLSYFAKIYRKTIGQLPSDTRKSSD